MNAYSRFPELQAVISKEGNIVNHEELRQYWRDRYEEDCRLERAIFNDLRDRSEIKAAKLLAEVFRPRPVDAEIDQLKSKLAYFQTKLNEHIDASKKAAQKKGKY